MSDTVTFSRMTRSKPKTSAEGQEQLSSSLARMALAPVASKRVPITEIGFSQCRFIVDDRTFPALCCGEPTLGGSWCAQHRALVFVRVAAPSNHRKLAPEPVKALAGAPAPGPVSREQPPKPVVNQAVKAGSQPSSPPQGVLKPKPDATVPAARKQGKPDAPAKQPAATAASKGKTAADQRAAIKVEARTTAKGTEKPSPAASTKAKDKADSAKKAEATRKPTLAKSPVPAKKAAAASPRRAAKKAAPARKASSRKSSAGKRLPPAAATPSRKSAAKRPAAKTVSSRKSSAAKRLAPGNKVSASRKGGAAKRAAPPKKSAPAGKKRAAAVAKGKSRKRAS